MSSFLNVIIKWVIRWSNSEREIVTYITSCIVNCDLYHELWYKPWFVTYITSCIVNCDLYHELWYKPWFVTYITSCIVNCDLYHELWYKPWFVTYITSCQYLYIWKSNLFITSYTVYICSNIYHTTMIYFVIFGASYVSQCCYLHILESYPFLVTAFLNEIIVSSECWAGRFTINEFKELI
jgi:hypothetical protein